MTQEMSIAELRRLAGLHGGLTPESWLMDWAADQIEARQAQIDALMLEYCPEEMTPEQVAEWERHQQAVPNV